MRAILLSCFGGVLAVISVQGDEGSAARTPWGLVADPVAPLVVSTCGSCHSPYLITHHHRDRDAWEKTPESLWAQAAFHANPLWD